MDDRLSLSARDYVESLHQNSRATLLYGKNNVLVQPVSRAKTVASLGQKGVALKPNLVATSKGGKHDKSFTMVK